MTFDPSSMSDEITISLFLEDPRQVLTISIIPAMHIEGSEFC